MPFKRGLFGYRRDDVDRAFARCREQVVRLEAEVDRLQKIDPYEAIGADVAGMVRELAEAVASTRERRQREVEDILAAAHADADQIRAEAEAFAESLIDSMLHDFEPRLAEANAERDRLARSLGEAHAAVTAALAAVEATPEVVLDLTVTHTNGNGHVTADASGRARI